MRKYILSFFIFAVLFIVFIPAHAQETILLFDNFDGASLNTSVWGFSSNCGNATHSVANGILTLQNGGCQGGGGTVITNTYFAPTATDILIYESRIAFENTGAYHGFWSSNPPFQSGPTYQQAAFSYDHPIAGCPRTQTFDATMPPRNEMLHCSIDVTQWHEYRVELTENTAEFYVDNTLISSLPPNMNSMGIRIDSFSYLGELSNTKIDYVKVSLVPLSPQCNGIDATIVGTEGDDLLIGTNGTDVIVGLGGNDTLKGRRGDDFLCGGDGNDRIEGDFGNDYLEGGSGNDELIGNQNSDYLQGGDGDDVLEGGLADDTISGDAGNDRILGNQGADSLNGGTGNDDMQGGTGADTMYGEDGADLIRGQQESDFLDGGGGTDTIDGGNGTDTCVNGENVTDCE